MDCARTAWAEGMGIDQETVDALTLVAEESDRRGGGARPELPPGDPDAWPLVLEERGWPDLAERVREIRDWSEREIERGIGVSSAPPASTPSPSDGPVMTPREYALARGWDRTCIEATAERGISEEDYAGLEEAGIEPEELLAWCQERVSHAAQR